MFSRQTLSQLINQALQDLQSAALTDYLGNVLTGQIEPDKSIFGVLAKVQAGQANELYGYLDVISLLAIPATTWGASSLAWGALVGLSPEAATAAQITAQFSGVPTTPLPAGTALSRQSDGFGYVTTAAGVVGSGNTVTVPATAATPGSLGNCQPSAQINIATGIPGINSGGVYISSVVAGTDQETMQAFKTRYLARYASQPQGGSAADYIEWALSVPGVTRAWTRPLAMGAGTVGVYFMMDVVRASQNGFPQGSNGVSSLDNNNNPRALVATGDQIEIANALEPLAPVPALVWGMAPVAQPINFAIADLGSANTTANQALIAASLAGALLRGGTPLGQTIYPSLWGGAIAAVAGVTNFAVISPLLPVAVPVGYLPTVGTITFAS
jgi:uncharacterized phage protein gp47/JayE